MSIHLRIKGLTGISITRLGTHLSLRTSRYFSSARLLQQEGNPPFHDLNVRTLRPPRTPKEDSLKNLRRSLLPNFSLSHYNFGVDFEEVLLKYLKIKSCTTITTTESYDLCKCISLLRSQGLQPISLIPDEIITFRFHCNGSSGEVMILGQSGSIICWGFDENTVNQNILQLVEQARMNPLNPDEYESEDIDYVELMDNSQLESIRMECPNRAMGYLDTSLLVGDLILINSIDPNVGLLHKAAFSSGFSRSTRLAVLENVMEKHIIETRIITEMISKGGRLNMRRSDALKSMGGLFLIRGRLNLYSELIETPDLYWSEPQLEKIFMETSKYLDIGPRINILNCKLDYSIEEARALMGVLSEKNSTVLELIIIYLITFEICFELYHFYEGYWPSNAKSKNGPLQEDHRGGK